MLCTTPTDDDSRRTCGRRGIDTADVKTDWAFRTLLPCRATVDGTPDRTVLHTLVLCTTMLSNIASFFGTFLVYSLNLF